MIEKFIKKIKKQILILDGAMGTMIQNHKLEESDFRGEQLKSSKKLLKGNNDILNLTQPEIISEIHNAYLESGCDIIETNTFNSTSISQADYACENLTYDLNFKGAKIARDCADNYMKRNKMTLTK